MYALSGDGGGVGRVRRRTADDWDALRARLIAETSTWLTDALTHPERAVRIPTIPAGSGSFPRSLAQAFWEPVLLE
jgi:hypothetical protein